MHIIASSGFSGKEVAEEAPADFFCGSKRRRWGRKAPRKPSGGLSDFVLQLLDLRNCMTRNASKVAATT